MMLRPLMRHLGRDRRLGAGRDDDRSRPDSPTEPTRVRHAHACADRRSWRMPNSTSMLLRESCACGDVDLGLDHVLHAERQIRHRDLFLHAVVDAVDVLVVVAGKMQHRFAHGLAGNGAGVDADAAHAPRAFSTSATRFPDFARLNRGPLPGRPRADHDHVEGLHASIFPNSIGFRVLQLDEPRASAIGAVHAATRPSRSLTRAVHSLIPTTAILRA